MDYRDGLKLEQQKGFLKNKNVFVCSCIWRHKFLLLEQTNVKCATRPFLNEWVWLHKTKYRSGQLKRLFIGDPLGTCMQLKSGHSFNPHQSAAASCLSSSEDTSFLISCCSRVALIGSNSQENSKVLTDKGTTNPIRRVKEGKVRSRVNEVHRPWTKRQWQQVTQGITEMLSPSNWRGMRSSQFSSWTSGWESTSGKKMLVTRKKYCQLAETLWVKAANATWGLVVAISARPCQHLCREGTTDVLGPPR